MSNYRVTAYKAKQDALDSRKEKLLLRFVPFQENLLRELELFSENALSSGLRRVSKVKRVLNSKELTEVELTLNDSDLVMISTDNVYDMDVNSEDLAAKIFVYFAGDENNTPLLDVTFFESEADEYRIRTRWFTQNGTRLMSGDVPISQDAGSKIAATIVDHFYRLRFSWQEAPTMKAALDKIDKRALGFLKG